MAPRVRRRRLRLSRLPALVALALLLWPPLSGTDISVRGQGPDGRDDAGLQVGIPVAYAALDGSESLVLTIDEIIDPRDTRAHLCRGATLARAALRPGPVAFPYRP